MSFYVIEIVMDHDQSNSQAEDRRKHRRFQSTAFLGVPLHLTPLPPFFGQPIDGQVMNLSAGGMSILIGETLPKQAKLFMELTFPNKKVFASTIIVRNVVRSKAGYLVGIEFLDLPQTLIYLFDQMAVDYSDCDDRITHNDSEICRSICSFIEVCDKPQKKVGLKPTDAMIQMKLSTIDHAA